MHRISPYDIFFEWGKLSPSEEALDCWINSPCEHHRKCKDSMENMDTDVRVWKVNAVRQTLLSIESNYEDQAPEYYYFWRAKRAKFLTLIFFLAESTW